MGNSRRIGFLLSAAIAVSGATLWAASYLCQVPGENQIAIWPEVYGSGKFHAGVRPGVLSIGRDVLYHGTLQRGEWRISLPWTLQLSYKIADHGFWPATFFQAWHAEIHFGVFVVMALVFPTIVSRRFRGFVKWACFVGALISFLNAVSLLPWVARHRDEPWGENFFEAFMQFLLLATPSGFLLYLAQKDPRNRPGHCRGCGCNLTGNAGGVCLECGKTVEQKKLLGCGIS